MDFFNWLSESNKRLPKEIRFLILLLLINSPVILFLVLFGITLAGIYLAIVFGLTNICATLSYFNVIKFKGKSPSFGELEIKRKKLKK